MFLFLSAMQPHCCHP